MLLKICYNIHRRKIKGGTAYEKGFYRGVCAFACAMRLCK